MEGRAGSAGNARASGSRAATFPWHAVRVTWPRGRFAGGGKRVRGYRSERWPVPCETDGALREAPARGRWTDLLTASAAAAAAARASRARYALRARPCRRSCKKSPKTSSPVTLAPYLIWELTRWGATGIPFSVYPYLFFSWSLFIASLA